MIKQYGMQFDLKYLSLFFFLDSAVCRIPWLVCVCLVTEKNLLPSIGVGPKKRK